MTRNEFIKRLPKLTNDPFSITPPIAFNGMSSRIFPLRASLDALQRVCDGYLNFVPQQAGYFRATVPYAYLMVLDYGQVAEAVARTGWFAQNEVFFCVPVEWYKLVRGQWVFNDWAVITPYIFVNDDFSVPLGRMVAGFPKVLAKVTQSESLWVKNVLAPVTLARIETKVIPEAYSGTDIENKVILEIERTAPSGLGMPFDAASPWLPWTIASNLAQAIAGFSRDATWLAQAMRISPVNPGADPGVLPGMLARMAPWFAPGGTGFVQNSLNLKQFRRSEEPAQICFQALTLGSMKTTAFNGGGLLGEDRTIFGDLSGGHSIKLYEYSSLPIARTLGLEVHRQWSGSDCVVAELKPVAPFWMDVDLMYDLGYNIAWRALDGVWKDDAGAPFDPQPAAKDAGGPLFNSTVTTAIDQIAGPFEFSDTTIRVLPLLAKKAKLQKSVDDYINAPLQNPIGPDAERVKFEVWSRQQPESEAADKLAYVYLAISSFGDVTSTTNNVGNWAKYQLSFMIPVEFQRMDANGNWEIAGVGLVPAFSFVDNAIAAIARLEVQGFDAPVANFFKPQSAWLSDEGKLGADPPQTLLRVDAEVWPALGEGQKATLRPVIEIGQGEPGAGLGDAPDASWNWAANQRAELLAKKRTKDSKPRDLKIARALALELLGNQTPFMAYSLKQFPDITDPAKACYQSLVRVPRAIKELFDLREIEDTLVVKIHDYPSLDIVGQLGLVATRTPGSAEGIVYNAQAIRPFFIRATLSEPLAERLASRAGIDQWTLVGAKAGASGNSAPLAFSTLLSAQDGAPPIAADSLAEALQDQMDPCRMSAIMAQAKRRLTWSDAEREKLGAPAISKHDARRALHNVDPQTVIESILSREWGNTDEHAKWRDGRRELIKAFSGLPVSSETSVFAESVLYRRVNNELACNPGAVASPLLEEAEYYSDVEEVRKALNQLKSADREAEEQDEPTTASERWRNQIDTIVLSQELFKRLDRDMESKVSVLASAAILKLRGLTAFQEKFGGTRPTNQELAKAGLDLFFTLRSISEQTIEGEPSERNNLDVEVLADQMRLHELLCELPVLGRFPSDRKNAEKWVDEHTDDVLGWALDHADSFRHLVGMARIFCKAQKDAFLNKLSRAYQKPDFCIHRDSVGADCDRLLPLSLSWNKDWYYGREVEYKRPAKLKSVKSAPGSGGK
jgi:hypothetical protein